jgi:hypothetical protein
MCAMKERLLADLDERIARFAGGDSLAVLDERALALVDELVGLGEPDAGSLARVAALHLCRYQALPPGQGEADLTLARAVYTNLHRVDPRLVPPDVRELLGLASPRERGVALLREYMRTGHDEHLDRAVSLLRQVSLEQRDGDVRRDLAAALRMRYQRSGRQADLDEADRLSDVDGAAR